MRNAAALVGLLSAFVVSHPASSAVLYESASGRTSYSLASNPALASGWLVRDYRPGQVSTTQFAAMPFQLNADAVVEGAELALTSLADWSGNYTVAILSDHQGLPGSTALWAASVRDSAPVYIGGAVFPFVSTTGTGAALSRNTAYWLFVGCEARCELSWWADTANPYPGATQGNGVFPYDLRWYKSDSNAAMFRIVGELAPVPEASTYWMLLAGLLVLGTVQLARHPAGSRAN